MNWLKAIWKYAKAWLLVTVIVSVFFITVALVATQNAFLSGTLDTVLGSEGRTLVSGDPNKYKLYDKSTDEFRQFETDLQLSDGVISTKEDKEKVLAAANLLNEEIAGEGFVLLKNTQNGLPLAKNARISVFGKNSANMVLGGSGSGGGNTEGAVSLYEGLRNAGFELNDKLVNFYEGSASGSGRDANPAMGATVTGLATGETPQDRYTDDIKGSYSQFSDAAVVVISRIGGEGFDLPRLQTKSYGGAAIEGSQDGGQHYLELDKNETALLNSVIESGVFKKVVVLVNCATSMELGFLEEMDGIDAALWIGSPGGSGANAVGRVLCGEITPSGRLVDTYVRDFTQDPTWQNFGDNMKSGGNVYMQGTSSSGYYYVEYEEGIYLGYRYYETRSNEEASRFGDDGGWYDENVVYPFGYGLSYAEFEWTLVDAETTALDTVFDKETNNQITVTVNVKNTSATYSGKDVVQLYFSAPYTAGGIEKAHVVLGGFVKTDLLAPGEDQNYKITLDIEDMASYDYNDANGDGIKGYTLESGLYDLYVGRNAHDCWTADDAIELNYYIDETITYPMDVEGAGDAFDGSDNQFDYMSEYMEGKLMSRESFNTTMPTMPTDAERQASADLIGSMTYTYDDTNGVYAKDFQGEHVQGKEGEAPKLYEMVGLDYNNPKWDELLDYLTVDDMVMLIGSGNFHTEAIEKIDKPRTIDPDGPAGFTNFMGDPSVHDTCFYAAEAVIGSTWNVDLAHDMGVMVGLESLVGYTNLDGRPYSGWYAPAVNIHRSPFSGRNWEYYSEDPLLSGKMGANVVIGARSKGVLTYVKHFVLNDQETNRSANGLVTWADEQTFREIYLKPFEIIVEEGQTLGVMSSFNRIGNVWAGGSYELLVNVLRKEWGFEGVVITDYNDSNAYMPTDQMIRTGGDLYLNQGGFPPSTSGNADLGTTDTVQLNAMRQASKNILYAVANSNAMNGYGEGIVWGTSLAPWRVMLIWVGVGLAAVFAVWGVFAVRKALKKNDAAQQAEAPAEEGSAEDK